MIPTASSSSKTTIESATTTIGSAISASHMSPKSRPLPVFFADTVHFSTKKERDTPNCKDMYPPRPPVKSCPPISRLRHHRRNLNHEGGARAISFLKDKDQSHNDSGTHLVHKCSHIVFSSIHCVFCHSTIDMISKHYDEKKKDLFFEQCFVVEGILGCGSFGKVYKVKSKEDGQYYAVEKSREQFKGHADR